MYLAPGAAQRRLTSPCITFQQILELGLGSSEATPSAGVTHGARGQESGEDGPVLPPLTATNLLLRPPATPSPLLGWRPELTGRGQSHHPFAVYRSTAHGPPMSALIVFCRFISISTLRPVRFWRWRSTSLFLLLVMESKWAITHLQCRLSSRCCVVMSWVNNDCVCANRALKSCAEFDSPIWGPVIRGRSRGSFMLY